MYLVKCSQRRASFHLLQPGWLLHSLCLTSQPAVVVSWGLWLVSWTAPWEWEHSGEEQEPPLQPSILSLCCGFQQPLQVFWKPRVCMEVKPHPTSKNPIVFLWPHQFVSFSWFSRAICWFPFVYPLGPIRCSFLARLVNRLSARHQLPHILMTS